MKKSLILLTTASFFAISCSIIDQFIWNNEFSWLNVIIGFIAGAALVLLSSSSSHAPTNKQQQV